MKRKKKWSSLLFRLSGVASLFIGAALCAAPLTWFPGPSLYDPTSRTATVTPSRYGNVLVGGTDYFDGYSYPEYLIATNNYWSGFGYLYSVNVACGAAVVDGNIIVYGGTDGTVSQNSVTVLNLTGDTPPVYASMNVPRSYFGYAADRNSRAYAIGGLDDNGSALASAERFTFDSGPNGTWSAIASLPAARFNFPAVFARTNYIYIFGGYTNATDGGEIASVMRYSVTQNTWTNLASMPVAVAGSAATLGPDGKIYVAGGLSGGVATDVMQVYDPVANSWTVSTPLPEALSGSSLGVDSFGRLIVMGGADKNGFDVSDVWRSQPLGLPDNPPVFTQLPATNATYLVTYNSTITATGNPPPTYQLISGPDGMSVDYFTGAIIWTPTGLNQIGSFPVTIAATNYAGATNWSFTITVPNPPPTLVSNLTVVGVTETSVTLAWSPEDPTVGPATCNVWLKHVLHDPKGSGSTIWYTQIGSDTTNTTITISGLAAGLSQAYYVKATGPGGVSGYASVAASTLPAPMPTNLRVTALTSTSIGLAWDAPVGGLPIASYEVLGWFDGIAAQYPLGFANIPGTGITITGLAPGGAMLWGVCVKDTSGNVSDYDYLPSLVINPVPVAPQMSGAATMAGGNFKFIATEGGSVMQTALIQATTNPSDPNSWVQIGSAFPTNNSLSFTDTNAAQFPTRFYRVVAP
jgi:hypothetical protein